MVTKILSSFLAKRVDRNQDPMVLLVMTNTQVTALRNFHTATKTAITSLSAREMALLSHNLSKTGDVATLPNGDRYDWSNATSAWVRRSW